MSDAPPSKTFSASTLWVKIQLQEKGGVCPMYVVYKIPKINPFL